jgi:hypothetical protein
MIRLLRRMRVLTVSAVLLTTIAWPGPLEAGRAAVQETSRFDRGLLRSQIDPRYEIVPLTRGIGLRPKDRSSQIRMIEIADGSIAIDGEPVTGRELRQRLGAEADLILQLSYLDAQQRRALVGDAPAAATTPGPREPPLEAAQPEPRTPESDRADRVEPPADGRTRVGERVRIFGNATVNRDEWVDGQVVAVLGSVRVDGYVADQVVAVLGSVELGPDARVRGDVTAVGGTVRRAPGAQIGGSIHEIDIASEELRRHLHWVPWWTGPWASNPFVGTARLAGTLIRLLLLTLLVSLIVFVLRQPIAGVAERIRTEPLKMTVVGLLAQLVFLPALALTTVILAVSIIGIPLLLLVPFVVVAMLLIMLGGFAAVADAAGGWAAARLGLTTDQPYLRVSLGVIVILAPLLITRIIGVVLGGFYPVTLMLSAFAFLIEYLAWTAGFGAALVSALQRWRKPPAPRTTAVAG